MTEDRRAPRSMTEQLDVAGMRHVLNANLAMADAAIDAFEWTLVRACLETLLLQGRTVTFLREELRRPTVDEILSRCADLLEEAHD
jgi:hypothetical protein